MAREIVPHLTLDQQPKFAQQIDLNRRTLWQRSFRSYHLTSDSLFLQKIAYTHKDPVRRGLCLSAEDYPWSSARMDVDGLYGGEAKGLPLRLADMLPSLQVARRSPPPQGAEILCGSCGCQARSLQ